MSLKMEIRIVLTKLMEVKAMTSSRIEGQSLASRNF
jgi:hypothetical protein